MKHAKRPLQKFKPKPKEDFDDRHNRIVVCKRCGKLMTDVEPGDPRGEFHHRVRKDKPCQNDRKGFHWNDPEVEPFKRKRDRRRVGGIIDSP